MDDRKPQAEQRTEQSYTIREVTHVQASWTEQERGEPGKFTIQLILDNGVDEYVLRPHADDASTLIDLFGLGIRTMFDMDRKVVMFGNLKMK